jgi:hypothetical protein
VRSTWGKVAASTRSRKARTSDGQRLKIAFAMETGRWETEDGRHSSITMRDGNVETPKIRTDIMGTADMAWPSDERLSIAMDAPTRNSQLTPPTTALQWFQRAFQSIASTKWRPVAYRRRYPTVRQSVADGSHTTPQFLARRTRRRVIEMHSLDVNSSIQHPLKKRESLVPSPQWPIATSPMQCTTASLD